MHTGISMDDVYNYEHFRTPLLAADFYRTIAGLDLKPGDLAPEFELPTTTGGTFRLSENLDKPVLLKFGSYS
jgi:hypothetical protein